MQVFAMADKNQNGELDFSEFVTLYNQTLELRKQYGLGELPQGQIQSCIDEYVTAIRASAQQQASKLVKSHTLRNKKGGTAPGSAPR